MSYMVKAIQSLRPDSQFVLTGEDYSSIDFHVINGEAPTLEEVEAEMLRLEKTEVLETEAREAQRAAILERLGLTEEEAKLLLS